MQAQVHVTFKQRLINLKLAFINECKAQAQVWQVLKSEVKTNIVDALKSGKLQSDVKAATKEILTQQVDFEFKSQDLHNTIKLNKFKDFSRTVTNARRPGFKYGSKKCFERRWIKSEKVSQLRRQNGLVVLRPAAPLVNGVQYPPRFHKFA